jgi:hypothetical protein
MAIRTSTLILALIPLVLIELGLMVAGYVDLARREHVAGGNKWIWGVVIFISFVGPILYFVLGREEQ